MDNNLQVVTTARLPAHQTPSVIAQIGDKNTQVAHANNVNNFINIIIPTASHLNNGFINNYNFSLSTMYYNLFVIGSETFDCGHFIVPTDRAITECISPEISKRFADLNEEAISQIKTFPSLFASENHQYGRTDKSHQAYFGIVTAVNIQDNGIKVYFQIFSSLPQQSLNENAYNFAIRGATALNELNRTHWAIKKVNLLEALKDTGISVLAPT